MNGVAEIQTQAALCVLLLLQYTMHSWHLIRHYVCVGGQGGCNPSMHTSAMQGAHLPCIVQPVLTQRLCTICSLVLVAGPIGAAPTAAGVQARLPVSVLWQNAQQSRLSPLVLQGSWGSCGVCCNAGRIGGMSFLPLSGLGQHHTAGAAVIIVALSHIVPDLVLHLTTV